MVEADHGTSRHLSIGVGWFLKVVLKAGKAFDEVRAMNRSDAEGYNLDIVERGDVLWREKFSGI
jgi:hypothetical protein